MSYDVYESSAESGQPIELYELTLGAITYKYTSDPESVTLDILGTYEPTAISREQIKATREEPTGDKLMITIPASLPLADNYVRSIPGHRVRVVIRRYHRDDPDAEVRVIFQGSVQQATFSEDRTLLHLNMVSIMRALSRQIPRLTYQGLCNHMLYDTRCTIDPEDADWKKTLTVTGVTLNEITVPGAETFGNGIDFFEGGYVEWDGDFRMIVSQSSDVLTLLLPFTVSPLGESVICRAGCKHRVVDCNEKFVNIENYGGFPFVPLKNPFVSGID